MDNDLDWLLEEFISNLRLVQYEWGGAPGPYDKDCKRAEDIVANVEDRLS